MRSRIALGLVFLTAITLAFAAPVPKQLSLRAMKAKWGESVTPVEGDEVVYTANSLKLICNGQYRDSGSQPLDTVPKCVRTVQKVQGEFEMVVRIESTSPADPKLNFFGDNRNISAGLYAIGNRAGFHAVWENSSSESLSKKANRFRLSTMAILMISERGYSGSGYQNWIDSDSGDEIWLRIKRSRNEFSISTSRNGYSWNEMKEETEKYRTALLAEDLEAGVFLSQTVDQKSEATFADFKLTTTGK